MKTSDLTDEELLRLESFCESQGPLPLGWLKDYLKYLPNRLDVYFDIPFSELPKYVGIDRGLTSLRRATIEFRLEKGV